jgi:hypothetical protein
MLATEVSSQLMAEKQALSAAMLFVFKEKRPTVYFRRLGDISLPLEKHIYKFARLGDPTKTLQTEAPRQYRRRGADGVQGL